MLAEETCTTDCDYGHIVGERYETLFEGSTFFGLRKHVRCGSGPSVTLASSPHKICHILSESVRNLETFSPELVDNQVCAASSHEVLVASGIVGV